MTKTLSNYKILNDFFEKPLDLHGGLNVIQTGRYYCRPGETIPAHYHNNYFELTVVTDGRGTIVTNDQTIEVQKNDVYVSFPHDKQQIDSSVDEPLKFDNVAFMWEKTPYRKQLKKILQCSYDANARIVRDQQINQLVAFLLNEFANKKDFYEDCIKNIILTIIVCTIRNFQQKETPPVETARPNAEMLCARIMNYVDVNVYEMEGLDDIQTVTNYNYCYVSTLFKKTTGITIREYVLNKKMEIAYFLVKENKLKICEIAEKLHYSDANAFSKAYKQKYGVSPKAHREQPD